MKKFILVVIFLLISFPAMAFDVYTSTGSGAINEAITFGKKNVYVRAVTLVLDAACATAENLVIRNSAAGALYYDADFNTETSYVWTTKLPIAAYSNAESFDVEFTNTDANTWILAVYYDRGQ